MRQTHGIPSDHRTQIAEARAEIEALCKSRTNWRESYPINTVDDSAAILFRGLRAAEEMLDAQDAQPTEPPQL